jgi:putative oxidoreductase
MLRKLTATTNTWATLPLRIPLGLVFIAHGSQKVLGLWHGPGLAAFTQGDAPLGLHPSWLWLTAAAFSELIGGILVLLGLMTRLGAFAIMCVMSVAILAIHWGSFFLQNHGMEFALSMFGVALSLLITGGGRASADQLITRR